MNTSELGRIFERANAELRAGAAGQREGRPVGHPRRRRHAPRRRARRSGPGRGTARAATAQFRPCPPRETGRHRDRGDQPGDDRHRPDCADRDVRLPRGGRRGHRHRRGACSQADFQPGRRRAIGRPSQRRNGAALQFLPLSRAHGPARRPPRPKSTRSARSCPRSGKCSSGSILSTPMRRMRAA